MTATARILDQLNGVKATGTYRWIARCPAHEDRRASLSVRELDDRVLLHCFAGCATSAVLDALGLTLADLYERPISQHFKPTHSRIPARDLLQLVSFEVDVVALILAAVLENKDASEIAWHRLATAARRIGAAKCHIHE